MSRLSQSVWWSADRLKPFYSRRRVRELCDHIDSLKLMLDQQRLRAARLEQALRNSEEKERHAH